MSPAHVILALSLGAAAVAAFSLVATTCAWRWALRIVALRGRAIREAYELGFRRGLARRAEMDQPSAGERAHAPFDVRD